jgi:hypothetical protein
MSDLPNGFKVIQLRRTKVEEETVEPLPLQGPEGGAGSAQAAREELRGDPGTPRMPARPQALQRALHPPPRAPWQGWGSFGPRISPWT